MNIEQIILEEYSKLQEQAAYKLRQGLPAGYKEKNKEIDSGGEMSIYAVKLFIKFFKFLKKEYPEVSIEITAGHDKFHDKYNSSHNTGEALDFVVTSSSADKAKVAQALKQFKSSNSDFSYLDEYETPTEHATGPHFHIQYNGASSQGNMLAKDVTNIDSAESNNDPEGWNFVHPIAKIKDEDEWTAIDYFQTVLDFAGFIPGFGDILDIINAAIYFGRGKYIDGVLSSIAVIPVAGSILSSSLKKYDFEMATAFDEPNRF